MRLDLEPGKNCALRVLNEGLERRVAERTAQPEAANRQLRSEKILQGIAEGYASKEIAHRLGISLKTVEAHRTQLMGRLGIRHTGRIV